MLSFAMPSWGVRRLGFPAGSIVLWLYFACIFRIFFVYFAYVSRVFWLYSLYTLLPLCLNHPLCLVRLPKHANKASRICGEPNSPKTMPYLSTEKYHHVKLEEKFM